MSLPIVQFVVDQYSLGKISSIQPLGNAGGFSGAQLWKVVCDRGEFCLRKWPLNSQVNVAAIHKVLLTADQHNIPIAAPISNRAGQSLVVTDGNVNWEIAPWLAGAADFNDRPSLERLREAVSALAGFHQVTSDPSWFDQSPGLNYRLEYLKQAPKLISEILPQVNSSKHRFQPMAFLALPKIVDCIDPIHLKLKSFAAKAWRMVNAICDIHHDHLFFEGESLSGIVDFGALKRDTPCLDLARMISSLRLDARVPWEISFEIYAEHYKLTRQERGLSLAVSECNDLLGFLNWMKWIFIEKRDFEDWVAVEIRLNRLFE